MTTTADPAATVATYGVHKLRAYGTPTGGTHWYVDTTDDDAPAINYDPDDADVFAVDPNGRTPDDNHDVYEQARAMLVAVEAAILFRSIVRHRYTRPEAPRVDAAPAIAEGAVWGDAEALRRACAASNFDHVTVTDKNGDAAQWFGKLAYWTPVGPRQPAAPFTVTHASRRDEK